MKNDNEEDLFITRIFNAPRELVWKVWTDPEMIKKWWGPKDFTAPFVKVDLRVGGKYLYCMHGKAAPEAAEQDFWNTGVYREIIPTERLVMTDSFADENGNVVPSSHYGMEGFPLELEVTVNFEDAEDGKTKMILHHKGLPEGMMTDLTEQGWNQSFDKFADSLN